MIGTVLAMVGCLLFVVVVLVVSALFIWWHLPCAEGD